MDGEPSFHAGQSPFPKSVHLKLTETDSGDAHIDRITIIALALVLLPLLTMWHEICGHAASCVALGGRVTTISAFYVLCDGLSGLPVRCVAGAGIAVDTLLSLMAWQCWKRWKGSDLVKLVLFYIWIVKGFVASGYLIFSGVTAFGDLGTSAGNGMAGIAQPLLWRAAFVCVGGFIYWQLYIAAVRALDTMLGRNVATRTARRRIAHLFYLVAGIEAILVGLFNPVGIVITIMSAAASSFGGNAGFISVGYSARGNGRTCKFTILRNWWLLAAGLIASLIFVFLGTSIHPSA